jgi:hypothetical protein
MITDNMGNPAAPLAAAGAFDGVSLGGWDKSEGATHAPQKQPPHGVTFRLERHAVGDDRFMPRGFGVDGG